MRWTRQGFTLIELMIVVAIVGVLAAIAIPSFRSYVYRSKTSQGVATLGEIRQRQEAYRAEFGQYANVPTQNPAVGLAGTLGQNPQAFTTPSPNDWRMLGFSGRGYTYFRFITLAAAPGADVAAPLAGLGLAGLNDFTFGASATANLDGDATLLTLEILSGRDSVYVSSAGGFE